MTRIKICGIDTPATAELAASLGVAAVGINLIPASARCRSLTEAAAIAEAVRSSCCVVALFADAPVAAVEAALERFDPELLQFHGRESAAYCEQFRRPYLKALPADAHLVAAAQRYDSARGWLVDASSNGQFGGTGETFDWALFPQQTGQHWILAGGLTPENVKAAVLATRPWAVDVSSGVEGDRKGVKDPVRLRAFCAAVAAADAQGPR